MHVNFDSQRAVYSAELNGMAPTFVCEETVSNSSFLNCCFFVNLCGNLFFLALSGKHALHRLRWS